MFTLSGQKGNIASLRHQQAVHRNFGFKRADIKTPKITIMEISVDLPVLIGISEEILVITLSYATVQSLGLQNPLSNGQKEDTALLGTLMCTFELDIFTWSMKAVFKLLFKVSIFQCLVVDNTQTSL